jgi:hypothetical protein
MNKLLSPRILFLLLALLFTAGGMLMPKPGKQALKRMETRQAANQSPRPADCATILVPLGLKISGGLCLLAAACVWRRRAAIPQNQEAVGMTGKGEWVLLLTGIIATGLLAWPRMGMGFWNDEQMTVADSTVGEVSFNEQNLPEAFRPLPWVDTVFGYNTPNNHMLYSIVARLVHSPVPYPTKLSDPIFSGIHLRLPAFFAGLAALVLVWKLGRSVHSPLLGWLVPMLLFFHPWWLRYTTEARGYGFLLALVPAVVLTSRKAIVSGRTGWWITLGVLQFLCLFTWPLAIHFIAWLNVAVLLTLIGKGKATLLDQGRFWLGGCLLGAALLTPLVLPLLPQLKHYLTGYSNQVQDAASPWGLIVEILTGRPWISTLEPSAYYPQWANQPFGPVWVGLVIVILLWGCAVWWRKGKDLRWLLLPLVVAPIGMVAYGALSKSVFYVWYLSMFVPGIMLLMGLGVCDLACRLKKGPRWLVPVAAMAFAAAYGLSTATPNFVIRTYPMEPLREVADFIKARDPANSAILGVKAPHQIYYPTARRISNAADLQKAKADALQAKVPFYIIENQVGLERLRNSDLYRDLINASQFRQIFHSPALYPDRAMAVHEWIGR